MIISQLTNNIYTAEAAFRDEVPLFTNRLSSKNLFHETFSPQKLQMNLQKMFTGKFKSGHDEGGDDSDNNNIPLKILSSDFVSQAGRS